MPARPEPGASGRGVRSGRRVRHRRAARLPVRLRLRALRPAQHSGDQRLTRRRRARCVRVSAASAAGAHQRRPRRSGLRGWRCRRARPRLDLTLRRRRLRARAAARGVTALGPPEGDGHSSRLRNHDAGRRGRCLRGQPVALRGGRCRGAAPPIQVGRGVLAASRPVRFPPRPVSRRRGTRGPPASLAYRYTLGSVFLPS
mmetsp:Transcript_14214/g.24210  ORF Transcript_14214/g.24210 Transcript_14214/m.24210 type:complete len:200 (+) Transcript_14214:566-1165(+)